MMRTRLVRCLAVWALCGAGGDWARADPPRMLLKESPRVLGREVKELILSDTIPVGRKLPPGLPTTVTYKMTPNTFRSVSEDAEGVFYQSVGPLQKHLAWRRGGVYMSKQFPDKLRPYLGDATDLRLPVGMFEPLHPGHAQKFRIKFASSKKAR